MPKPSHTPPPVGRQASVRVDQEMHDNLELIMRSGLNVSEALREAVATAADVYDHAWTYGGYPEGAPPVVSDVVFMAYVPPGEEPSDTDPWAGRRHDYEPARFNPGVCTCGLGMRYAVHETEESDG